MAISKKDRINTISNAVIALSTFIGVGGAIGYYLKEMRNLEVGYIVFSEIVYLLLFVIVVIWLNSKLK